MVDAFLLSSPLSPSLLPPPAPLRCCRRRGLGHHNYGSSTASVCLTQQATLWEGLGLFGGYLVYVLAVTQGHRVPPMLKADRVVWYALKAQVGH